MRKHKIWFRAAILLLSLSLGIARNAAAADASLANGGAAVELSG